LLIDDARRFFLAPDEEERDSDRKCQQPEEGMVSLALAIFQTFQPEF
jgi:hypothetical protein